MAQLVNCSANATPISVGIPTYGRGFRVIATIREILACDPPPKEVLVHVDEGDGRLQTAIQEAIPTVRVLQSPVRIGPGGGRHRCIQAASQPIFASFDDDSWPIDRDFFSEVTSIFERYPRAAALASVIHTRGEACPPRGDGVITVADYVGCGYAIRKDAYSSTLGHIDRPCAYGMEEVDLSMQLHAQGWHVLQCARLRVFHDTQLLHHMSSETVAGTIENVALRAFLRYPASMWPFGALQVGNAVLDAMRRRRFSGLLTGLRSIPSTLVTHRAKRRPLPADMIRSYLRTRRPLTR